MGVKTMIQMHWGTFPLGEDLLKEGKVRFLAAPAKGIKKNYDADWQNARFERALNLAQPAQL
jgi:hypothetical protein